MTPLQCALDWCRRGYHPVPIPPRTKGAILEDWQQLRITEKDAATYFNGHELNLGVLLGDEFGSADADLDCPEAIAAAPALLPPTGLKFGRPSAPASHWFYRVDPPMPSLKFRDPLQTDEDEATVAEFRCTKKDGGVGFQTVVPYSVHPEGEPIRFEPGFDGHPVNIEADVLITAIKRVAAAALLGRHWPKPKGGRNDAFLALAGVLARAGWPVDDAIDFNFAIYRVLWGDAAERSPCAAEVKATFDKQANGETTGIPSLKKLVNERIVTTALEWLGIQDSRGSKPGFKADAPSVFERLAPYPEPIREEGFTGIAGEFVRLVEPHTEADRNFLLVSFLVHAGNVLGRDAWTWASADKHHTNLFACGVGTSSTGRKGSAASPNWLFFQGVDNQWAGNITNGLSTGEGLIAAVRDPIKKLQPSKKGNSEMEEVCIDEGIQDKRLLVIQSEFYGALQAMKRQGNTLSATIRDAYDKGNLRTLIKNNPHKATGAHVSIIANITKEELLRGLLAEELDNGFANRFLWVCSQRSKELPDGIWDVDFAPLQGAFRKIRGHVQGPVQRDAEAGDLWGHDDQPGDGIYHYLSRERGGLFGKVCSRAPAQVIRLSLVYALLDGAGQVQREHQDAALAVWQYCEDSAAFIFGDATGDPTADAIVGALRTAGDRGMTRTELSHVFQRNTPAEEITRALKVLHEAGHARWVKEPTNGRSTYRWFLTQSGGVR